MSQTRIGLALFVVCACAGLAAVSRQEANSTSGSAPAQLSLPEKPVTKSNAPLTAKQYAAKLISMPQASELRRFHDVLTQEPHVAGTPGVIRHIVRL
jgi:hypothetical protein